MPAWFLILFAFCLPVFLFLFLFLYDHFNIRHPSIYSSFNQRCNIQPTDFIIPSISFLGHLHLHFLHSFPLRLRLLLPVCSVSALLVDTDRDGEADLELLDTVGNGSFDTIVNLSQDFTGVEAAAKLLDLDQDGRHDLKLIDTDADGIHDTIVELEMESDLSQAPETSNFKIKPVIIAAPGSAPEAGAPVFHPFGSLANKGRKSNNFTVIYDPSAPSKPVNKCRCNAKKPKEYVGAEIYPNAPAAPAAPNCGCNKPAPAAPQHIAPRYYKPAPPAKPAAAVAPAKPAAVRKNKINRERNMRQL